MFHCLQEHFSHMVFVSTAVFFTIEISYMTSYMCLLCYKYIHIDMFVVHCKLLGNWIMHAAFNFLLIVTYLLFCGCTTV